MSLIKTPSMVPIFVPFPCCVKSLIFSCVPLPLSNELDGCALYGVYDGHYYDYDDDLMRNSIDNYYFGIHYQISVYLSNFDRWPMNCRRGERVCSGILWFVWRSTVSKRQPCRWIFVFSTFHKTKNFQALSVLCTRKTKVGFYNSPFMAPFWVSSLISSI